jgi:hypothetical protein
MSDNFLKKSDTSLATALDGNAVTPRLMSHFLS